MTTGIFNCFVCGKEKERTLKYITYAQKHNLNMFCSQSCSNKNRKLDENRVRVCKCGTQLISRQKLCTPCATKYRKKWYYENKDKHREATRRCLEKVRRKAREWITAYLLEHPCVDCGESDIGVLEFDHILEKTEMVSVLVSRGSPIKRLQKEVANCVVRCGNCHKRKTAVSFNYYFLKLMPEKMLENYKIYQIDQ